MAKLNPENRLNDVGLEHEVAAVSLQDGTNQEFILEGASNAAFSNDTIGTTPEDGFINCQVDIAGTLTVVKVPFWLDD